jgi:hypothetical protein
LEWIYKILKQRIKKKVNIHGLQRRHAHCPPLNTQIFEPLSCCILSRAERNPWCEHHILAKKQSFTDLSTPDKEMSFVKTCSLGM